MRAATATILLLFAMSAVTESFEVLVFQEDLSTIERGGRKNRCNNKCFIGPKKGRKARKRCPRKRVRKCIRKGRIGLRCKCPRINGPKVTETPVPNQTRGILLRGGSSQGATILSCPQDALYLEVSDILSIEVGFIVRSIPIDLNEDFCSSCTNIARKVTKVEEKTEFNGIVCPSKCILLTTTLASVSEIYARELLKVFGVDKPEPSLEGSPDMSPEGFAELSLEVSPEGSPEVSPEGSPELIPDEALESIYGCNGSGGTVRSSKVFDLEGIIRQRFTIPNTCGDYERKNSDGRCTYSNCFVGVDGNASDCLYCKTTCSNGCTSVPTREEGLFDFSEACCSHDKCYASSFSKADCDFKFLIDMLTSCEAFDDMGDPDEDSFFPIRILPKDCRERANLYYVGVHEFGDFFYNGAQEKQGEYEKTPECVAMCPTTQRAGGQGTTTISVNLMIPAGTFEVSYNFFFVPDELDIMYEGKTIFSTGGLVSGAKVVSVTYSGKSTIVQARLNAPRDGTRWTISIACPPLPK